MLDRAYRQRLESDLARWEADGVIAPAVGAAVRMALPPLAPGINIPVVLGIVGGLLIAAAFLAFVAAHWIEFARVVRLAILFSGSVVAFGVGGWFARGGRPVLADLCGGVGSIIFGAGIALVCQMYHLGDDFAGGMLLWTVGALVAAVLTGSRGALAVALVAANLWSGSRILEMRDPHVSFLAIWLIAAGLALAWNSRVAAHLVALGALRIGGSRRRCRSTAADIRSCRRGCLAVRRRPRLAAAPWRANVGRGYPVQLWSFLARPAPPS